MRPLSLLATLALVATSHAAPISTTFTYQGELTDSGTPVAGSADFRFTLYDAEVGGAVAGATIDLDDVPVADGRFTAALDFGDVFDGQARWIDIAVRSPHDPSDTLPFTTLAPRQPMTAAPYALHAENGGWARSGSTLTNETTGFVGINRDYMVGLEWFGVHAPVGSGYGGMYVSTEGATALPFYGYYTGTEVGWHFLDGGTGDWYLNLNSANRLTVRDEGQVGIGVSLPTEKLEVAGTIHSTTGGFRFPDGTVQTTAATAAGGNTLDAAYDQGGAGNGRTIVADAGAVQIAGPGGLEITASTTSGALAVDETSVSGPVARFAKGGQVALVVDGQGEVAIGATSAVCALDVREAATTPNVVNLERNVAGTAASDMLQIEAHVDSPDGIQFIEAERGSDIEFRVWGNGDVTADGTFSGPADFAEMVKVERGAASVEPGDVMVIDPDARRGFARSETARSTLVAGVYSTNPGFLGSEHDWDRLAVEIGLAPPPGADGEAPALRPQEIGRHIDEVPLAVVGIVPCKVSAENGSIRAGDLLVTATLAGHAMRDDDARAGTIVGKALGSLASGTGVVPVLVTLQ